MFVIEDWDASGFPGDIWVTEGGGWGSNRWDQTFASSFYPT